MQPCVRRTRDKREEEQSPSWKRPFQRPMWGNGFALPGASLRAASRRWWHDHGLPHELLALSHMQWQQPACNASFYYSCRGDRRRSVGRACDNNNLHSLQGGICRVDTPAAGRTFCDSDLQAVMPVSLAFLICHDHWKGHHNYMEHIQSIWQSSAMGLLVMINSEKIFFFQNCSSWAFQTDERCCCFW